MRLEEPQVPQTVGAAVAVVWLLEVAVGMLLNGWHAVHLLAYYQTTGLGLAYKFGSLLIVVGSAFLLVSASMAALRREFEGVVSSLVLAVCGVAHGVAVVDPPARTTSLWLIAVSLAMTAASLGYLVLFVVQHRGSIRKMVETTLGTSFQ